MTSKKKMRRFVGFGEIPAVDPATPEGKEALRQFAVGWLNALRQAADMEPLTEEEIERLRREVSGETVEETGRLIDKSQLKLWKEVAEEEALAKRIGAMYDARVAEVRAKFARGEIDAAEQERQVLIAIGIDPDKEVEDWRGWSVEQITARLIEMAEEEEAACTSPEFKVLDTLADLEAWEAEHPDLAAS